MADALDGIMISVSGFFRYIQNTADEVFYGVLVRDHGVEKYTVSGWREKMEQIKAVPVSE